MRKLLSLLIIYFLMSSLLCASISFNDVVCVFSNSTEKVELQDNMIAGAASFLSAQGKALLVLSIYEKDCKGNLDIATALTYAREALKDLEKAHSLYIKALNVGKSLGYNEYKRPMFSSFNYSNETIKRKLNQPIVDKVKAFLVNMDVIGIYEQNIQHVDNITFTLKDIVVTLEAGQTPGVAIMWQLLQEFNEATLFGNYTTILGGTILQEGDASTQSGPPICEPD